MAMTRDELDRMLGALARQLDVIVQSHPDVGDFRQAFAAQAAPIEAGAGDHIDHVRAQLDAMLVSKGRVAPDEDSESGTDTGYLSAPPVDESAAL